MPDTNEKVIVTLQVKNSDVGGEKKDGVSKRPFPLKQAEGIMNHEEKLGKVRHTLPTDSAFKRNTDGTIVKKPSK